MHYERINLVNTKATTGQVELHIRALFDAHFGALYDQLEREFRGRSVSLNNGVEIASVTTPAHKFGASIYSNHEKGTMSFEIEPKSLTKFTDQFFHSEEMRKGNAARNLTVSDLRLQSKISKLIASAFFKNEPLIHELKTVDFKDQQKSACATFEINSAYGDMSVLVRFHGDYLANIADDLKVENANLPTTISAATPTIPVDVNVQLWCKKVPLDQFMQVEVGTELPIFLSEKAAMRVAHVPLFVGQLVERSNQLLFEIHEPFTNR